jgi:hypothetical protein
MIEAGLDTIIVEDIVAGREVAGSKIGRLRFFIIMQVLSQF